MTARAPLATTLPTGLGWLVLTLTLVLSTAVGLLTPYIVGVLAILLTLVMLVRGTLPSAFDDLAARLFLAVLLALAVCFALAAKTPHDMVFIFNFIMLALFAPLRLLLQRLAGPDNGARFARLAFAGTVVALAMVVFNLTVLGDPRGQGPLLGAILLGNTAVLLGFLSLTGIVAPTGRLRWLYLAGPLLGILTALLTGSRGPLLAVVPLTLVAIVAIARHFGWSWRRIVLLGIVALLVLAGLTLLVQGRGLTVLGILGSLVTGHGTADETTDIRMALYRAGWQAFLASPWFGHGWANMMSAVRPFMAPDMAKFADLPQLHDDVVNFAVAGGVIGVCAYLLLLAAPFVAALRSVRDRHYRLRLFGTALLAIAFLCDGLTDLMIGFEFHTALFACLAAILLGYCRDPAPAPAIA